MSGVKQNWKLGPERELRCEVSEAAELKVRVLDGSAEIFGVEITANGVSYTFKDQNIAIFTWYGCQLETEGTGQIQIYDAEAAQMSAYVNTHIQLESRRDIALGAESFGPRVSVDMLLFTSFLQLTIGASGGHSWTNQHGQVDVIANSHSLCSAY